MMMAQPLVLRTVSPLSLDHGFCHIQLSLLTLPSSNSSSASSSPSLSSSCCCSSVHSTPADYGLHGSVVSLQHPLDRVCLHVSRELCSGLVINSRSFSVFPYDNSNTVSVVFPEEHRDEILCKLQSLCPSFQIKTDFQEDDTLGPGLLMRKAMESSLKDYLICEGWMILEPDMFIYGCASQFPDNVPMEAVTIAIETGPDDKIDFLLCPDIVKFRPFEVAKVLPQVLKGSYDDSCEVILDQYMQNLPEEDILELKCVVVPVMRDGFVSGCCKSAPQGFSVDEIWQEKYGLVLPNDVLYIRVSFLSEQHVPAIWFPACFVLRKPGVIPATPAVRKDRFHSVLEHIISRISEWNFFNAGVLRLEKNCAQTALSLQKVPCWSSAKTTAMQRSACIVSKGGTSACDSYLSLLSSLETKLLHSFRRPKPLSLAQSSTDVSLPDDPSVGTSYQLDKGKYSQEGIAKKMPGLNVPSFSSRKSCKENLIGKTEAIHISINHGLPEEAQKFTGKMRIQRKIQNNCSKSLVQSSSRNQSSKASARHCLVKQAGAGKAAPFSLSQLEKADGQPDPTAVKKPIKTRKEDSAQDVAVNTSKSSGSTVTDTGKKVATKRESKGKQQGTGKKTRLADGTSNKDIVNIAKPLGVNLSTQNQILMAAPEAVQTIDSCISVSDITAQVTTLPLQKGDIPAREAARPDKRTTASSIDIDVNNRKVLQKHGEGRLSALTVPELKCFLSTKKTKMSGKKEELIQRVLLLLS